MRKLLAACFALALSCGIAFAGDFYNGDVQLKGGFGFGNMKYAGDESYKEIKLSGANITRNVLYGAVSLSW